MPRFWKLATDADETDRSIAFKDVDLRVPEASLCLRIPKSRLDLRYLIVASWWEGFDQWAGNTLVKFTTIEFSIWKRVISLELDLYDQIQAIPAQLLAPAVAVVFVDLVKRRPLVVRIDPDTASRIFLLMIVLRRDFDNAMTSSVSRRESFDDRLLVGLILGWLSQGEF
jgi:hypothetical protein